MDDLAELLAEVGPMLLETLDQAAIEDSARACEGSLYRYLAEAWPYFDPSEFIGGWHIEAVCEHLEAVSRGEIKRLLINIPPRHAKTSIVAIAWPTWTWAQMPIQDNPLVGPGVRFLCASYGANKAQQDGVTARRLIASNWYQQRWGERAAIQKDRDNQEQYDTEAGGSRISTGIPESLGKGGIIRICFPYDQLIQTECGPLAIGDIVDRHLPLDVPSLNEGTGKIELKPIVGWHRNPGSEILLLTFDNGATVRCTPDHKFRIAGGDWKAAASIPLGTSLPSFGCAEVGGGIGPGAPSDDGADCWDRKAMPLGEYGRWFVGDEDSAGILGRNLGVRMFGASTELANGGKRPVFAGVVDILSARAVAQVAEIGVPPVAVAMPNFLSRGRRPSKCQHDEDMDVNVSRLSVLAECDARVTVAGIGAGFQHPSLERFQCAVFGYDGSSDAVDASPRRDFVVGKADRREPDFIRLVAVESIGHVGVTFCISVADNHNMLIGDKQLICAANCDDPHKTSEVESLAVIESQIRAYNEVWRTRSNDPTQGAEVIIMQRLGESDLSGFLLENEGEDIVHLCLPAMFESDRRCVTVIGFEDPREEDGEPLWPERFDSDWCELQQKRVGAFAWAGQFQQRPAPRGGGIIRRELWQLWPPVDEPQWSQVVVGEDGAEQVVVRFPPWECSMAYLDTAFTEKQENAYCAFVRFGVFADTAGRPKVMLAAAWRDRPTLRQLARKVLASCRTGSVDTLVIENRAGAEWVKQELQRLMDDGEFQIILDEPRGDKVARVHSVSVLFEDRMVFAPDRKWAEMVIDEVTSFPKGRWRDLCLVAGTQIATRRGSVSIENVTEADDVLTPFGWRRVLAAGPTGLRPVVTRGLLTGTADHPVFVLDQGFVSLDSVSGVLGDLTICGLIRTLRQSELISMGPRSTGLAVSADTMEAQLEVGLSAFTSLYGKQRTGAFPRRTRFITVTAILLISAMTIWSAYQSANIVATLRMWRRKFERLLSLSGMPLPESGTDHQKGMRGIEKSRMLTLSQVVRRWLPRVCLSRPMALATGVAELNTIRISGVDSVVRSAEDRTRTSLGGLEPIEASTRTSLQMVYNLTVAGAHCYYANKVLVHNCDCVSGGLGYLRRSGLIRLAQEFDEDEREARTWRGNRVGVAERYGI